MEIAEVWMLTPGGEVVHTRITLRNAAELCEKQKHARKSFLLRFTKLKPGTTDDWEVLYSLPTPIFVNGEQVV
jgi:hypothetical protein